ncbi:hypothetical protein [Piscinibacter sakaiensis]
MLRKRLRSSDGAALPEADPNAVAWRVRSLAASSSGASAASDACR